MNVLPRPARHALFVVFAAFMVATRYHHFGDVLHLPDASMALFFLGGLFLSTRTGADHLRFAALMALAVGIDVVSVGFAGVSDHCVTPSYAALLPAYAVLWYGGRLCSDRLRVGWGPMLGVAAAGLACAALSFAISNGAFYWLGGRYAEPNMAQYLARAWQWGPLFVRTTLAWIAGALVLHAIVASSLHLRAGRRPADV